MKNVLALICGVVFGIGLAVSGMTDTAKVIGFLDLFGDWDADLLFVMAAAVVTSAVGFTVVFKVRKTPLLLSEFSLPTQNVIDKKLLIGASIFGIGWGVYGYCPGPAISSLIYLSPTTCIFVAMMIAGMYLGNIMSKKIAG